MPAAPSTTRIRPLRMAGALLLAASSTLALGLAAGAAWMVATMLARHPLPWLALPAGIALALAVRRWVHAAGRRAAALAACGTLISALYVNALIAAAKIAGIMGIGLLDAMRQAGAATLLWLGNRGLAPAELAWIAAGIALAAWVAIRPPRR